MNSPKQGTIVVKKGMGFFTSFFVIVGLCCLCSCLSSMWTTAKGVSAVSSAVKNLPKKGTAGPNIKDMVVTNMDTETMLATAKEQVTPVNLSKKRISLGVYKDCGCSDPVHETVIDAGVPLDRNGEVEIKAEDQWKCVKASNAIINDLTYEFKGTKDGLPTSHSESKSGPLRFDRWTQKVGCEPGEDYETTKLKLKWRIYE
jgi:hypothetical protein